jgi:ATP-dependent DNA ligase
MESWLRPMLADPVDVVPTGDEWIIEGKLDGWRMIAQHTRTGRLCVYGGRNGNLYSGQVPYIEETLKRLLPPSTAIDGELIGRGTSGTMGDVQSIMTMGVPHVPHPAIPALTFVAFDLIELAGDDLRGKPWTERREKLEALLQMGGAHVTLSPYSASTQAMHEEFLAHGLEGSVCKRTDSRYFTQRTAAWVKIKPQKTAEATIVGFKPGRTGGDLDGKVGAFRLEMIPDGAQTTVKCGTDERHDDATAHPENWLGKVIEIKHHGLGENGVPRHPQFLRVREDRTETPRERQMREAANPKPQARQPKAAPKPGAGRMRNYGAMGQAKLERCLHELEAGVGDAHYRCLNGGSGSPDADVDVARRVLADKYGVTA